MKIRIPSLQKMETAGELYRECSEEVYRKGLAESQIVKGMITFEDGSRSEGTREMELGEPIYRMGGNVVNGKGFMPDEYFAPSEAKN